MHDDQVHIRGFVSVLLILIYLLSVVAQGDLRVPFIGGLGGHGASIGIVVRSDLFNAWIFLDGENKSFKTPHEIEVFKPGNHTFMLLKEEIKCCEKEISISPPYCKYIDFNTCNCNSNICNYKTS